MLFKRIHIIINPASGTEEPIIHYLHKGFENSAIEWNATVITKQIDIKLLVNSLIGHADLIAVYGGDGTVVQVAQALIGKEMPMAIIPGGTANVMAKELGIPIVAVEAIALLTNPEASIIKIDTGFMNNEPFLIRINFGIMSEMVSRTNKEQKDSFGQLAYGITAFETLAETKPMLYKMKIDGVEINEMGVSLTITNSGSIGIAGFSFLPDISISDGYFDVILLHSADFFSLVRVASTTLFQTDSEVLKRWKCKEITIELPQIEHFIFDDMERQSRMITIKVNPLSLHMLVPSSQNLPA